MGNGRRRRIRTFARPIRRTPDVVVDCRCPSPGQPDARFVNRTARLGIEGRSRVGDIGPFPSDRPIKRSTENVAGRNRARIRPPPTRRPSGPSGSRSPQADIDDLRRRLQATRWPEKETVADQTQGVPLATIQELVRYWANDYDFRRFEARLNARPAVPDRDRRPRHPLHPRQVAARERVAADHHARLAGLGHRDAERGRPAHRPDGTRRRRGGRVRRRGSVDARLRVLREADRRPAGTRSTSRMPGSR